MQPEFIPTAWTVAIVVTRGDGSKFRLYEKVLLNHYQATYVKKQWPEQLKELFYWPEDRYPGYSVDIEIEPLYRLNRVLEPVAEMLEDADYYKGYGQYDNEAIAQETSREAAEAVRKLKA